ncbi:MAG: prepilin-type N-terminal cleavage/methylation domain-containing protein [Lentisphaerae bacterium]|nr:prepilin-type N-terminal cleavage/methylation domain-containing protein [Lentisphaerota bacterium]
MSDPRHSAGPRARARSAFSLIEVLAAMTILAILVLMAAQLFAGSAQFWKLGSRRIEQDMSARAALELIGRQIVMALGDEELLTFRLDDGDANILDGGGRYTVISMVTMDHQARRIRTSPTSSEYAYFRDVQQTQYRVLRTATNAVLMRMGVYREYPMNDPLTGTPRYMKCYQDPMWADASWPEPQVLAENVIMFTARVVTQARTGGTISATPVAPPYISFNSPDRPLWVDLTIALVDDDDMIKGMSLRGVARTNLFNRTMRRYTHRAFLQNARGMDEK